MIALIKTFTLQPSAVSEHFQGTSSISSAFAVKIDRLPDSPTEGNKVVGPFALAYGGYELDGVILAKELEKTKLIRQK